MARWQPPEEQVVQAPKPARWPMIVLLLGVLGVVFGLLHTANGVSPGVGAGSVATSLIVFTALYSALAVVEVGLILRYAQAGPPEVEAPSEDADRPPALVY